MNHWRRKINSAAQVAFASYLSTSTGSFEYGIFRGDGGPLTQIARTGLAAPDMDGNISAIDATVQFDLNDSGQVAFVGYVSGAANYAAVYRGDGTTLSRIVRTGQAAPDGDGTFQSFYNINFANILEINNQGHIAFLSTLTDTSNYTGIFVYDGTNVVQAARMGQSLDGSTITSLGQPSLNEQMQVAYTAQLADGRQVAARFEPQMFWRNAGSGSWGTGSNWSLRVEPTNPYDVFIVTDSTHRYRPGGESDRQVAYDWRPGFG